MRYPPMRITVPLAEQKKEDVATDSPVIVRCRVSETGGHVVLLQ